MTSVNSVISFAGIPALPFGGVGDSGFGRIHGADGLKEFARPKAIARQRFKPPLRADDVQPDREDRRHGRQADHHAARRGPPRSPSRELRRWLRRLWTAG